METGTPERSNVKRELGGKAGSNAAIDIARGTGTQDLMLSQVADEVRMFRYPAATVDLPDAQF